MQRLTLLTLLLLPLLFFACQEDNNNGTQPGEDLVVSFNNLSNGEEVSDSITVSVDASPQESASEVSLTFAGEQVNTITSAPFEYGIDTRTVADGSYTLEATATTEAGESFTEDLSIEVSNPLATLEMPVSGGDPGFKGYYYGIHQKNGSLIKGGSIALGQQIDVEATEAYPSDTLMITLYYETNEQVTIKTFTNAMRGSTWRMNFDQAQPELADSLTLNITAESSYDIDASTSLTPNYDLEGADYTFPAVEGTNQYYVMESYQANDRGYQYGTVQDGNTKEVATLSDTPTEKNITVPEDIDINLSTVYAYNSNIRNALRVDKNFIASNPLNFDLPVDEFSNFAIIGNIIPPSNPEGLTGILTIKHQSTIPSELPYTTGTAQANTTGNNLSGTVNLGDAQAVVYQAYARKNQTNFFWSVNSGGDLPPMPLNIPAVVKNRFPVLEDIIWDSETSYVIKSDAISNYQDLLDVRKSSIYGYMPGIVNTIPENVYSSKAFLFNPLISNSSEYVSIVFDTNANSKKDHAFRAY